MEDDFWNRIMNYRELAHHHMQLAYLMRNNHQFKTSLILCSLVLTSITRALYISENKSKLAAQNMILDDFLLLIRKDLSVHPEIVDLMDRIDSLCYSEDDFTIDLESTDGLIRETAGILGEVSLRVEV